MRVGIVAHRRTSTNAALARARPGTRVLAPAEALKKLRELDIVIGRLDVAEALDGIEIGLWELARLRGAGVRVLNPPGALVAAHDKLATSRILAGAGIPHPRTVHVTSPTAALPFAPPVVVKPRFGSWGRDVVLCETATELRSVLEHDRNRRWFRAHGALVQELVPPVGHDLRLVVAGAGVVGAIRRVASPGEWRTNVALGATREPVTPPQAACEIAVAAARAIEADLVGVDLLPAPDGGHVVLELNGAVEFTQEYALQPGDVFEHVLAAILPASEPAASLA
jgi:[lysine-biosynthesis-protein LysW]---L-2-aminoadipate ligase